MIKFECFLKLNFYLSLFQKNCFLRVHMTYKMEKKKKNLKHCWWEYKMVAAMVENSWQLLQKLNNYHMIHLRIYPKQSKAGTETNICTPLFTAALFTITKKMETTQTSTNKWTDTQNVVQSSFSIQGWLIPEPPTDTKIHECSSSLYKMYE